MRKSATFERFLLNSSTSDFPDTAFIDRADIVQYVGLPPQEAVYWILKSCIMELIRTRIIAHVVGPSCQERNQPNTHLAVCKDILDRVQFCYGEHHSAESTFSKRSLDASTRLWELAGQCDGMSGRSLRRLPVLAHARHIGMTPRHARASDVEVWLDAMNKVVAEESTGRTFTKDTTV